jgi:hypothetical protein
MNVKEIIEKYLRENEFDGLFHADSECACLIDDLCPCEDRFDGCEPGYKVSDPSGENDWIIQEDKP